MTHLLEIRLDANRLAVWATNIGIAHGESDYIVHSVLCAAYGDLSPKPFVLKPGGRDIRVLGYCGTDAAALEAARQLGADPEVDACFVSEASKAMPADWKVGQLLGFELRAAPTRQRARRGGEVDAVALAEPGQSREQVYADWLASRVGAAAALRSVEVASYRAMSVKRRGGGADGKRRLVNAVSLPEVVFKGVMAVTDPALFSELLGKGIGRHKAFGFGALLLKPATA